MIKVRLKKKIISNLQEHIKYFAINPVDMLDSIAVILIGTTSSDHQVLMELVENIQKKLKEYFMLNGLMIGQFFQGCNLRGVHSQNFFPFDVSIPIIGMRRMVPQDIVFVSDNKKAHKYFS